jgi:hypothetical protein
MLNLLLGLRLNVIIWNHLNENWCSTTNPSSSAPLHLQMAHGIIMTRLHLDQTHHCDLRARIQTAILHSFSDTRRDSPGGCLIHCPPSATQTGRQSEWWHRRLLQFVPELSAESVGYCVFYRNMAIVIYQSAIRDLHRARPVAGSPEHRGFVLPQSVN